MDPIDRIDALIKDRHLLTHPFYVRWREGTLPLEAIQEYTRQYYAFESAFPRLLSASIPRPMTRSSANPSSPTCGTRSTARSTMPSCGCASRRAWAWPATR